MEGVHQFTMYIIICTLSRTTGEGRAGYSRGGGEEGGIPTALGRIYVYLAGTYYNTRGAYTSYVSFLHLSRP